MANHGSAHAQQEKVFNTSRKIQGSRSALKSVVVLVKHHLDYFDNHAHYTLNAEPSFRARNYELY